MWKDYSFSYIKNNRASSMSIIVAAFISSLFLSFICCMFYNVWLYDTEKIVLDEGDWQGRITGELDDEDLLTIQTFGNVEDMVVNKELSGEKELVVDIYFYNMRTVFQDMKLLTEQLDLEQNAASCHTLLLSRYLIHDPLDEAPPLLLAFYLVILLVVSFSLMLVIRNSFAVSMNARIHQLGILSSIGAAPSQIRTCLMQEIVLLCAAPVLIGTLIGIVLMFGTLHGMNAMLDGMAGRHAAVFQYHPLIFISTMLFSALTVIFSAIVPAWKLSRLTPLESIRGTGGKYLKRKKHSRILAFLFGMEGEMAGNALKAHKKALRTSTISLTLSFMGFTMMLCFFSLTDLSTKYTYFEKYQDAWDIMATVKDTKIEDFELTDEINEAEDIEDCIVYQKAEAFIPVSEGEISKEFTALGGLEAVAGSSWTTEGTSWIVKAPIVILDDISFEKYCRQIGIAPQYEGTVILNRIWDSLNSNFRHRTFIPFLNKNKESVVLQNDGGEGEKAEVQVLGFTGEVPLLKEEYADYSLVQFMPLSLWKKISGQLEGRETDTLIRILGKEDITLTELNLREEDIVQMVGQSYEIESENRIEDKISNENMISGYKVIIGIFCYLLAFIGIANVFSYTLGLLHQRKREFAQYMSIGQTPAGMRKMFCIEACVIAGRPILITLPLTAIFIIYLAKASYLNVMEVLPEIPVIQIILFSLIIGGFVAFAYYIGGKKVLKCSLVEALRDDTLA